MDAHIKKVYVPMTETGFYILLCLRSPNHGYGIVQKVKEIKKIRSVGISQMIFEQCPDAIMDIGIRIAI